MHGLLPGVPHLGDPPAARAVRRPGGLQLPCLSSHHGPDDGRCGIREHHRGGGGGGGEEEEKQGAKENEEEQPTGEDLSPRRPWSQCPGCVLHSPKERK